MFDTIRAVLSTLVSWALAFLFLCVAIYSRKRSSPAQFYPWLKVKTEMLTDVRAYNWENGTMWMSCAFIFFVIGAAGLLNNTLLATMYVLYLFPGGLLLNKRYRRILTRYLKAAEYQTKENSRGEKDAGKV